MAVRTRDELRGNDIMASGEIDYVNVAENIRLAKADVEEAIDQFVRISESGMFGLYKAPDQDIRCEDENILEVELTTTPADICTITPDQETGPSDTTWSFSGELDNSSDQNQTAYVQLEVNGVEEGDRAEIDMQSSQQDRLFLFSGTVAQTYPASTIFTMTMYAEQSGNLKLGDILSSTKFKITKAQAAPVTTDSGVTQNVTIGHGANIATLHIVNGIIKNVT